MKLTIIFFAALFFRALPSYGQNCDSTLWNHVYKPKRLVVYNPCIIVIGTIMKKQREPDGDWHIELKLDAGQDSLPNAKNKKGYLNIEVICANLSWQPGTVKKCKSCSTCRHKV